MIAFCIEKNKRINIEINQRKHNNKNKKECKKKISNCSK